MKVLFLDSSYEDLFYGKTRLNYHPDLIKAFQKKVLLISGFNSIDDLYKATSLHYEKLKGDREGWSSIRINNQWRLIVRELKENHIQVIGIKGIEDYH